MTFDYKHIILSIIIGLLLVWGVTQSCSSKHQQKLVKQWQDSSNYNRNQFLACWNSVKNYQVIHSQDSCVIDSMKTHPRLIKYVRWDTVRFKDTSNPKLCESWFNGEAFPGRAKIEYSAHIVDCKLSSIIFPKLVYPVDTIKYPPIIRDTCKAKEIVIPKLNTFGMDFDLIGNSFKKFPNVAIKPWYLYRQKWGMSAGLEYNTYHGEMYLIIGGKIVF